jgi:hypothetical protein
MPTHTFRFTDYLYRGRNEREYEVEVTYGFTPGTPARLYGDYPHPAEDAEVEILSVTHNGAEFDTTREEENVLFDHACDRAGEDYAEWCAEAEEYRAEARREERWLGEAA